MFKLKRLFVGRQIWVLMAGAFFLAAPLWASRMQQVWGRNLFATPDSMALLGVTLLVSLLGYYFLPDFFVASRSSPVANSPYALRRTSVPFLTVVGLLSLVGLVFVLYWVNRHILHSFLSSADEHSCYFLAECLRRGKLYADIPPLADFFKVVHVGMRDGKWFSVYPPGWPLIWALGLQFNIVDWLNPVLSALSVFFFYEAGKRLFGRVVALLGLILMCLNPFFMFTAAAYFSHGTCLLCISVFLYAFLRWREAYKAGKDPVGWAFLCAFAVGYGLMTRYLTMAAVAGPFFFYHYLPIFFNWRGWSAPSQFSPQGRGEGEGNSWLRFLPITLKRPQLRKSDWIAIGIIAIFMILILYQNYLVTGKPFRAPNKHDKSWERLGFRRDYTPLDGFFYLIARVFFLMDWFAPACVAAYLVILCRLVQQKTAAPSAETKNPGFSSHPRGNDWVMIQTLFRFSMVFIAIAYFFYYSWGGNQWGPRYYWEGMPFLCIAVADWIVSSWRDGSLRVRKFFLVFVIVSITTSGILFAKHAEFTEESSRQRRALYDFAENTAKGQAIIFIHGFLGDRLVMAEEDAVRNSPFLDGRILYVHDLVERNKELMAAYPGREYYRGTYDRDKKVPRLDTMSE